jgi:hypothetical protein
MNLPRLHRLLAAASLAALAGLGAAPPLGAPTRAEPEDLSHWRWHHEVRLPAGAGKGLVDFILPPSVFGRSRPDQSDLRLSDAAGKTVPYALRVRTPRDDHESLPLRAFNRVVNPDSSVEVSIDLGEAPPQHNEITVNLAGTGYGRPLRLDGSADGKTWSKVLDGVYVVHLEAAGQTIDQRRFSYPPSRFRFLRVRVRPDRVTEKDEPNLESVQVFHGVRVPGEELTLSATLQPREPVRLAGEYGSAWVIDLGGDNVPCEKLSLDVEEQDFARFYTLEVLQPDATAQAVASGELRKQPNDRTAAITIPLQRPVATRRLRLTVQDYRNPPLTVTGVRFTAAARQVVFAVPTGMKQPLRLYSGNPSAPAPRYDFAASLPPLLDPPPSRAELSGPEANKRYVPPPKPWTERLPWLVDAVLAAACAVLLGVLSVLARAAIRGSDAGAAPASAP